MVKKSLAALVLAFALFYLLSQPRHAAGAVQGAASAVGVAFGNVAQFFTALFA